MSSERSWPLTKYSDLNTNGKVYPAHTPAKKVDDSLPRSRDSSILVHLQQQKIDKKFRFRLSNLAHLKEVINTLSQFVNITDVNQGSQDTLSQQSNSSQISQGYFTQNTFSQSSNSQSESSFNDLNSSPFYDESSSQFYPANSLLDSGIQPEFYDDSFSGGTHSRSSHSSTSYTASLLENRSSLQRDNSRHTNSNPYTSPFIRSVNTPRLYVDRRNSTMNGTPKNKSNHLKNQSVQTDSQSYDKYSVDDFVQVILALNGDASFELLVKRIKEAIEKIRAPRPIDSYGITVQPCSTLNISAQNNIARNACPPNVTRGNGVKEDFSAAFGNVERLLSDF